MLIRGVSVQLADIALGVNPAQGMEVADIELSGVVAQDHGSGNAPAIGNRPPEPPSVATFTWFFLPAMPSASRWARHSSPLLKRR